MTKEKLYDMFAASSALEEYITMQPEDGITMQDIRLIAGEGKLSEKTIQQSIAVIRKHRGDKK